MISTILGWFFLAVGVIFFLKPNMLKKSLQKKVWKKLKKILFVIACVVGIALIRVGLVFGGILPKVIMIIGIITLFKGIYFLRAKSAEKMISWVAQKSDNLFRVFSFAYIIFGLILLFFV